MSEPASVLVVAHQTAATPGLLEAVRERAQRNPAKFHLVELPLHEVAGRYLRKGPPFLERYLPFWIAVTAERWALLLLPVIGILLPLIRILPALYNSQMRKRVTRWYREVNEIDHVLATGTPEEAKAAAERLREVQAKLARIPPPPPGLMGELYDLKQHVEWLLRQADTQAAARHSPR